MPQIGDIQHGATSSVRWNGSRWEEISSQPQAPGGTDPGTAGLFSGGLSKLADSSTIPDLWHGITEHPTDTLKGFFRGAAEGLPAAAKIAQVAAPLVTGGASIPAQMAVGGGTQILSDLADRAAGDPDAPQTFTSAMTRGAVGAAIPAGISGIYRGAQAAGRVIKMLPEDVTGGVTGGLFGGYEGYKHGGVSGAVLGAVTGAAGGSYGANKLGPKFAAAMKGMRGSSIAPEVETEGAQFASRMRGPRSTEVPGSSYRPPPEPEMPLPRSSYADVDRHMPNISSGATAVAEDAESAALPRSSLADVDHYMPNTPSSNPGAAVADEAESVLPRSSLADVDQYMPNTSSGPSAPSDVSAAIEGLTGKTNVVKDTAGGFTKQELADLRRQGFNQSQIDRLSAPESAPASGASIRSQQPYVRPTPTPTPEPAPPVPEAVPEAAPEAPSTSNLREIPRRDELWGRDSVDMNGFDPQATSGYKGANNLLYDPRTPTNYLREQLSELPEGDPARAFLARAISQRNRLGRTIQPTD